MNIFKQLIFFISLTVSSVAFAGEFGDNCTNSLSKGSFHKTNCEINEIFGGKTTALAMKVRATHFYLSLKL